MIFCFGWGVGFVCGVIVGVVSVIALEWAIQQVDEE